jgi:hypothetical protein
LWNDGGLAALHVSVSELDSRNLNMLWILFMEGAIYFVLFGYKVDMKQYI